MRHRWLYVLIGVLFLGACGIDTDHTRGSGEPDKGIPKELARVFRDASRSPEDRARALLACMTLDEKIGQMTQPARDFLVSDSNITKYGFGSVLSGGGSAPADNSPDGWADMVDHYQSLAAATRLGIPLLYGADAVHGHNNVPGAVIFPHNIGLGAAASPELVEKIARATALEMAATGVYWTFAPCVAVPQDERWGRTYEGFSESTELVSVLGAAAVRGYQSALPAGPTAASGAATPVRSALACAKHFIGDGGTSGGVDQGDTATDEASLRAMYLPPYQAAIEAGVASVMVSFSSWNGLKLHQHRYLVTEVLKQELGFEGFVVSDWAGIKQLPGGSRDQIRAGINAGIDMVMVPDTWQDFIITLRQLVEAEKVSMERIDDAVYRILKAKFRSGLFENALADRALLAQVGGEEHRELAREAARSSVVVLKNDGVLPLASGGLTIGVCGAAADDIGAQCGGWTISWQGARGAITEGTTILEGLRELAGSANTVLFADTVREFGSRLQALDVLIVVAAEAPYAEGQGDDAVLAYPEDSARAVRLARESGITVVSVLLSGRPLVLGKVLEDSSAMLAAWLPGSEGAGVADILMGKSAPSGRLPYTWFENVDAIPVNAESARAGVLFPAGFGLSW